MYLSVGEKMIENTTILPKLGSRSYIQGTTLFEELIRDIGHYDTLEFHIKKPIFSNEVAIYHVDSWDASSDSNALLFYEDLTNKHCKFVSEGDYKDESLRIAFDEAESLFGLEKFADKIEIHKSPYNFIKTIVVINKILLSKYLIEDFFYIFVYLKLDEHVFPEIVERVTLKENRRIGGYFYTDIFISEKKVGTMGFKMQKFPFG